MGTAIAMRRDYSSRELRRLATRVLRDVAHEQQKRTLRGRYPPENSLQKYDVQQHDNSDRRKIRAEPSEAYIRS